MLVTSIYCSSNNDKIALMNENPVTRPGTFQLTINIPDFTYCAETGNPFRCRIFCLTTKNEEKVLHCYYRVIGNVSFSKGIIWLIRPNVWTWKELHFLVMWRDTTKSNHLFWKIDRSRIKCHFSISEKSIFHSKTLLYWVTSKKIEANFLF